MSDDGADTFRHSLVGCLLGMAVGDSIGLPYEGLSPRRAARMFGPPDRHRFLFRRGMVSDDTEHACLTAQSLVAAGDDVARFQRQLASRMRRWLLGIPAGVGLATLRATLKLCFGVSPDRSGVDSAGNGPAMRSVLLGAAIDDPELLRQMVRVSTRLTHTDPKAECGALAIAVAARMACEQADSDPHHYLSRLSASRLPDLDGELMNRLEQVAQSVQRGEGTKQFARAMGLENGVTGYMYHTAPVTLHAWLRSPADYRAGLVELIECGGDADTTAAILGGLVGCRVGKAGIPESWWKGLCDWPRTVVWMERLAVQLAEVRSTRAAMSPIRLPVLASLLRNAVFTAIVLTHGFRRLLPP